MSSFLAFVLREGGRIKSCSVSSRISARKFRVDVARLCITPDHVESSQRHITIGGIILPSW